MERRRSTRYSTTDSERSNMTEVIQEKKNMMTRSSIKNQISMPTNVVSKNVKYKSNLKPEEICQTLNDFDDENEEPVDNSTGKQPIYDCKLVHDEKSIRVKISIKKIPEKNGYPDIEYVIGMREKQTRNTIDNTTKSSRPKRSEYKPGYFNEDQIEQRHEQCCLQDIHFLNKISNKNHYRVKTSPRKRLNDENSVENNQKLKYNANELDDNRFNSPTKKSRTSLKSSEKPILNVLDRRYIDSLTKNLLDSPHKCLRSKQDNLESPMRNLHLVTPRSKTKSETSETPRGSKINYVNNTSNSKRTINFDECTTPTNNTIIGTPRSRRMTVRLGKIEEIDVNEKIDEKIKNDNVITRKYETRSKSNKKYNTDKSYRECYSDDEDGSSDENYISESEDVSESDDLDEISDSEFSPKSKKNMKSFIAPKKSQTPAKNSGISKNIKKIAEVRTPLVHQRHSFITKPSTPLQEVRMKLHVSVIPKSLPCREEQFNDIYSFLHARLADGSGGCIYISGVPGTGKTATVNEVIRCLTKAKDTDKLNNFNFIEINGMKLSEPRQAYVQILKQLTGTTTPWEEAHKILHERFSKGGSKKNIMTLLLVDELDLLCTKRQDVVYNLLDWPCKTNAKLVVVTIANTMDLPERILMGKVTSRLGLTRLTFPPYNYKQLEEIVVSRLKSHNYTFKGETIQLVARKVAGVSGDARRALDICRRATEVAELNNRESVTMVDVKKALDEMIASPKIQAIKHCSDMERLFLQAVCAEVSRTGVEEVIFKNVYFQLNTLCTLNGKKTPNDTAALFICARLGSWRLLLCDHSRMDIHQRLLLNVSTDDVQFAIQNLEF